MHHVLDLIAARAASGSEPGSRAAGDGARLALVLEGGGMRGVVSCGMAAAIERLGLTRCFDLVVGTSAGALNGAALLAGSAEACLRTYSGAFAGRMFIDPRRLVLGRPAVDVGRTLDHNEEGGLDAGRHARTLASPIALHCVAVDVETAAAVDLHGFETLAQQRGALLASSRLPWVGGPPVQLDGRRYLDGGLADPIPVDTATAAGATHVLALQTRPEGVPRASPGSAVDRVIERRLRALNPDLVALYRQRAPQYERITAALATRTADADGTAGAPYAFGLRPVAGSPVVSQLERKPAPLAQAGAAALDSALAVLTPLAAAL